MAESFTLESDSGVSTRVVHDGNVTHVQDTQELGDLLERCAASRAEEDRFIWNRRAVPFKPVMEIPLAVINTLKRQGVDLLRDEKALRIFINDPVNKAFRLSTGKV